MIDSRDFLAAKRRADNEVLLPTGPRCATSNASRHHGQTYMLLSGPMFRVRFSHR